MIVYKMRTWDGRVLGLVIALLAVSLVGVSANAWGSPDARPSEGWTLHIDAKKHFPGNPELIAHHYCKGVAGGFYECQLYDSDAPDARLVGVEVVVPAETYNKFSAQEQAMWHYHKTEIPKVQATLPDLSPEEAAKVLKSLEETYGKIYLLWDPSSGDLPIGNPNVYVLDSNPTTAAIDLSWIALLVVVVIVAIAAFVIGRRSKLKGRS